MEYKIKFYPAKSERYTRMLAEALTNSGYSDIRYSSDVVSFVSDGCVCKVFVRILTGGTGICVYFADDRTFNKSNIYHIAFKVASKEYLIASAPHSLKLDDFISLDKKSSLVTVQKEKDMSKQNVAAFAKTMGNTTFESHPYSGGISLGNTIALYTIAHVLLVIAMVLSILSAVVVVVLAIVFSATLHNPSFMLLLLTIIPIGIDIAICSFFASLYAGAANEMRVLARKINNLSNR